jgi:hypothetical protein
MGIERVQENVDGRTKTSRSCRISIGTPNETIIESGGSLPRKRGRRGEVGKMRDMLETRSGISENSESIGCMERRATDIVATQTYGGHPPYDAAAAEFAMRRRRHWVGCCYCCFLQRVLTPAASHRALAVAVAVAVVVAAGSAKQQRRRVLLERSTRALRRRYCRR